MLPYALRRLLWMLPTLVGITFLTFALMHLAPGDPAALRFLDPGANVQDVNSEQLVQGIARFRREHLLDQPLLRQYLHYVGPFDLGPDGHPWFGGRGGSSWGGLLLGDLKSEMLRPQTRIIDQLRGRLAVSMPLALVAILLAYAVALPLGILSALRPRKPDDVLATVIIFLLYAIPSFWAGLMLQLFFGANGLGWLPVSWLHGVDPAWSKPEHAWQLTKHALLPVLTLAYGGVAYLSRQMRSGMIEVIRADYIRTARAKGLPERVVILKHALRNSLIPVLTLFASVLPVLIGGSIIVEAVFDVPGMGTYAFKGFQQRDYNIVMATTTLSAVMTLLGILLSDLAYAWADPRVRFD